MELSTNASGEGGFRSDFASPMLQSDQLSIAEMANVKERDHSTGDWIPDVRQGKLAKALKDWSIDRVQLVSTMQGDRVRVYGGRQIPSMKALKRLQVPTRAATEAELAAVEMLRSGKEHDLNTAGDLPLLVSALVAKKSCAECHRVKSGDFMGALAIRFKASEAE